MPDVISLEYIDRPFRVTPVDLNAVSLLLVETGNPWTDRHRTSWIFRLKSIDLLELHEPRVQQ